MFGPTYIAELELAPASHMIAALILLYPEKAAGALLILRPLHKLDELCVIIIVYSVNAELLAGHTFMVVDFACQAVLLEADRAVKFSQLFGEEENVLASWAWTP